MLNHITLMGRLTRDPELRYTASQIPVASFAIACDRDYSKGEDRQTDFVEIVAWRGTAEFVSKYFGKGSMAVVSGRLQTREWQDKDGNKRKAYEILAENVYFGESKGPKGTRYSEYSEGVGNQYSGVNVSGEDFGDMEDADEGELPF